jgi:serine/threonine-protein kinase
MVFIDENDYIGHTKDYVQGRFDDLGVVLKAVQGVPAPSPSKVGLAYSVDPTANVEKGSTVTVTFYTAQATPPAPSAATAPAGPYTTSTPVTVSWTTYTGCPAGQPLAGYNFTVDNGTPTDDNPILPANTSETINPVAAGTMTVTYTAICGTGANALTSSPSPALTVIIS